MASIREIENAIRSLPPEELKQFRAWFTEFDAIAWDAQIESDIKSGKLEKMADSAKKSYENDEFKAL